MLEKTCAFVVSEDRRSGRFMFDICDEIGIGQSRQFADLTAAEKQSTATPVCFFLIPAGEDDAFITRRVREIRTSDERNTRFAPIILLTPAANEIKIQLALSLGFDEILAPPWTAGLLRARFQRQLSNAFDYFTTDSYFGPDRRRLEAQNIEYYAGERRDSTFYFQRFSIQRNVMHGVEILTNEKFSVRNGVKRRLTG